MIHQIAQDGFALRVAAIGIVNLSERKLGERREIGVAVPRHFLKALFRLGHLRRVGLDGAEVILGDFAFGASRVLGRQAGKGLRGRLILGRLGGKVRAPGRGAASIGASCTRMALLSASSRPARWCF